MGDGQIGADRQLISFTAWGKLDLLGTGIRLRVGKSVTFTIANKFKNIGEYT